MLESVKSMKAQRSTAMETRPSMAMAVALLAILPQIDPAITQDHCPDRAVIRCQRVRTFERPDPWSAVMPFGRAD